MDLDKDELMQEIETLLVAAKLLHSSCRRTKRKRLLNNLMLFWMGNRKGTKFTIKICLKVDPEEKQQIMKS